jgi:HAE1 family hydrophobic/amphiphilic exporter-1
MNDAQRKINAIINDLPDDAQAPSLNKFSLSDLPIMTIGANGKWTKLFLRLSRQETCASTFSCAGVALILTRARNSSESGCSKMQAYGLSIPQVQQNILSSNLDFPTGNIQTEQKY